MWWVVVGWSDETRVKSQSWPKIEFGNTDFNSTRSRVQVFRGTEFIGLFLYKVGNSIVY